MVCKMVKDAGVNLTTLAFLLILIILGFIVFESIKYQALASVLPISFDGENDYVLAPMPHQLVGIKSFTLEVWLRLPDKPKPTRQNIITIGSPERGSAIALLLWPDLRVQYNPWGIGLEAVSKLRLSTDRWHHIVVIYDEAKKAYLYIDGKLDSQYIFNNNWYLHGNISIAKRLTPSVDWFKGSIAIIRIWSKTLTREEIMDVFNGNPPRESLILYFSGRIKDGYLIDESGENNHGKIYGATSPRVIRPLFSNSKLLVISFYMVELVLNPYLIILFYITILLTVMLFKYKPVDIYMEKQPLKVKILLHRRELETSIRKIFVINNLSLIIILLIYTFFPNVHRFTSVILEGLISITFICLGTLHILMKQM